jgi:hypothetical protein
MAVSIGEVAEQDVAFHCPSCGLYSRGPLLVTIVTEPVWVPRMVPLWPGGPTLEVPFEGRWHTGYRELSTSACACRFNLDEWDMRLETATRVRPRTWWQRIRRSPKVWEQDPRKPIRLLVSPK